jgi:hypothetical protein
MSGWRQRSVAALAYIMDRVKSERLNLNEELSVDSSR